MRGLRSETEPYVRMMAARIRERHRASWGLCESGAAGPSPSPAGDAAGHLCIAVAGPALHSRVLATGQTDRAANMERFACELLHLFEQALQAADGTDPTDPADPR